jgi:hypothetical protein
MTDRPTCLDCCWIYVLLLLTVFVVVLTWVICEVR